MLRFLLMHAASLSGAVSKMFGALQVKIGRAKAKVELNLYMTLKDKHCLKKYFKKGGLRRIFILYWMWGKSGEDLKIR